VYLHSDNDQILLRALAKGERAATEFLYKQHAKIFSSWLSQNGGSQDDASDIFQEAMVVLYEKAQDEAFLLTCKVGTYIFAICKNLWYKKCQQLHKMPVALDENSGDEDSKDWAYEDDIQQHHEREQNFEKLNMSLAQLGEPCQSILKEYYHQNRSMQEIAMKFGYTNTDNAKTQKYKCLQRLKKLFLKDQMQ